MQSFISKGKYMYTIRLMSLPIALLLIVFLYLIFKKKKKKKNLVSS